jgi:hypothetical protein
MMRYDAVLACYAAIYFQVITNTFVLQFQILRKLQEALFGFSRYLMKKGKIMILFQQLPIGFNGYLMTEQFSRAIILKSLGSFLIMADVEATKLFSSKKIL